MQIELRLRPLTLNEAEMAEKIVTTVRDLVRTHGGDVYPSVHTHQLVRHGDGADSTWVDHGLVITAGGYCHIDGARVAPARRG